MLRASAKKRVLDVVARKDCDGRSSERPKRRSADPIRRTQSSVSA